MALAISDGNADLIKTRWQRQCLIPFYETAIFCEHYFPRYLQFLRKTRQESAIVERDPKHIHYGLLMRALSK